MRSDTNRAIASTIRPAELPLWSADFVYLLAVALALVDAAVGRPSRSSLRLCRHSQGREHKTCEADAEFLQRSASRDGLCQTLGQFIEFIVHNFPFLLVSRFVLRFFARGRERL